MFSINSFDITGSSPYIIGEIGSNFNQSLELAYELIDGIAESGADAAKFQLFRPEVLATIGTETHEVLEKCRLPPSWLSLLRQRCTERSIDFIVAPFDLDSLKLCVESKVDALKIASSELCNFPLIQACARSKLPLIISTGMCELLDIDRVVDFLAGLQVENYILLHCASVYPLPDDQANLRLIAEMIKRFGPSVGFSDHTTNTLIPALSVAFGAKLIEKHVTLDKTAEGPDHFYALTMPEFSQMVAAIKVASKAAGDGKKVALTDEKKFGRRRGIYVARDLPKNHVLTPEDLVLKAPAIGIFDSHVTSLPGMTLMTQIEGGKPLSWDHLR